MKIVLVGSKSTEKTKLVNELKGQQWNKYSPTIGCEVVTAKYNNKEFVLWDTAGDEHYAGLRDAYWISADKFIVLDKKEKWDFWKQKISRMYKNIPIIYTETPNILIFDEI